MAKRTLETLETLRVTREKAAQVAWADAEEALRGALGRLEAAEVSLVEACEALRALEVEVDASRSGRFSVREARVQQERLSEGDGHVVGCREAVERCREAVVAAEARADEARGDYQQAKAEREVVTRNLEEAERRRRAQREQESEDEVLDALAHRRQR